MRVSRTLRSRFQSSALNPYTYKDRVFGLPETQDFYMMYVRTDILEPLGVTPPETWDDLPGVITTLSQQNMEIGIPQALLGSLLVQNGLSYYQPGFEKTVFSTQEAYDVYAQYIAFYRDYKQPYNYNAANRFKTGVMPIVFDLLSFYNTMAVLAPEIKGQWEVYALPGVRQPDGSIRRSGDATGCGEHSCSRIAGTRRRARPLGLVDQRKRRSISMERIWRICWDRPGGTRRRTRRPLTA